MSTRSAEHEFCAQVVGLAEGLGALVHWCPDSRKCLGTKGFPDLVIAGPRGIIPAECKMPGEETTAEQDRWGWTLHTLSLCLPSGLWYCIWFPVDLENGTIERTICRVL